MNFNFDLPLERLELSLFLIAQFFLGRAAPDERSLRRSFNNTIPSVEDTNCRDFVWLTVFVYDGNPLGAIPCIGTKDVTAVLSLVEEVPRAARNLGIAMPVVEATTAEQLDIAFASAAGQRADAIIVFGDTMVLRLASRVVALAAEHRLPAMYLFGPIHQCWRIDQLRP